ncbi:MAG: ImmA/IrrE family metallo-endopeptidase [candidate division NC10 bacterium]|nr:ImmA/IrrE family metallo-endopeptidase [candidate division NC10 bacterium]
MPERFRPPFLSYDDLRRRAGDFLRTHHPAATIPVPIEEIIEFRYRIDIIPVPGLQEAFEVDGFISSDMKSITVDAFVYEHRPGRYRFTLAHELAHAVLHRRIFQAHRFRSIEGWKRFQREMDEEDRRWLEWQAYAFAGLVLVPADPLGAEYLKAVRAAARVGLSLQKVGEVARSYVADWLAGRFGVSAQVIERRLDKDELWPSRRPAG